MFRAALGQVMIFLGLGGNLPSRFGPPRATLEQAIIVLDGQGVQTRLRSPWYGSRAVPASDQPDFVNAVIAVETALEPAALLQVIHAAELQFGRRRGAPNAARILDIDLLAYGDRLIGEPGLAVPHPRLHERAFVLGPLCDIAPDWLHPVFGRTARQLYHSLGQDAAIWRL